MSRLAALAALLVLPLLLLAGPAAAEAPFRVPERVTDRAGVLDATARSQVTAAVDRLRAERGEDLFVVYVRSFDGASGQDWADRTAQVSQLGNGDVLLAVAVEDRAYGTSYPSGYRLSESATTAIETRDVEPALARNDWAGAAVALADGLRTGGSGGGTSVLPYVVGGAVVVGGGAYLVSRRRRKGAAAEPAPAEPVPADPFPGEPTDQLAYRSSQALLQVDDAVGTSEQELAAARGHFGDEAVAGFATALEASRADLLAAFAIRQQLDDDIPETEPQQRAMHAEILRLTSAADARLDAQVESFDRLRALEADAAGYVDGLASRLFGLTARLPRVETAWSTLTSRYAGTALAAVAGNLPQARALLGDAEKEIGEARTQLGASRPAYAVVDGRAAEDALTQAETLLDGVERRDGELVEAAGRIAAARAEVEQDLAEAAALPDVDQGVLARARAAVAAAQEVNAGSAGTGTLPDPLAALHLLDEADTALDQAIAGAREAEERRRRAATALDQTLVTARAAVSAAADFVATRRGAVGTQARTRLAEAQRHLAAATAGGDPATALREAQQAEARATQALDLARADVDRWSGPSGGSGSSVGVDLGSLVLGGILSGALRGGGGGGYRGGGGGYSPGSFGGSASRGRRGGGGRF